MKSFSALDLTFVTRELQTFVNERIDSFYLFEDTLLIKIYVRSKGNIFLNIKMGKFLYCSSEKELESESSSNFAQYLRKHLENGFIRAIEQVSDERILKITIEKKDSQKQISTQYFMYIELFSSGNCIVTDSQNSILNAFEKKAYKDRKVFVKENYVLPPAKELSLLTISREVLENECIKSDLSIVKFLALKFGLGGKYSEEVCLRTKLEKNSLARELSTVQFDSLFSELATLLKHTFEPTLYKDSSGAIVDYAPFKLLSLQEFEILPVSTFSECLQRYYENFVEQKDAKTEVFEQKMSSLKERLGEQQKQLIEFEKQALELTFQGNAIYSHYMQLEEILNLVKPLLKTEFSLVDAKKKYPQLSAVTKFNTKEKKITVKIDDYKKN